MVNVPPFTTMLVPALSALALVLSVSVVSVVSVVLASVELPVVSVFIVLWLVGGAVGAAVAEPLELVEADPDEGVP
ncbi:hypothetical protein D1872_268960 [compost metagenome]